MKSGTKWKLALGSFIGPFIAATVSLFTGASTFAEWADFVQLLTPMVLGLYTTSDVVAKALAGKRSL
jgi:hypothetical protein